MKAHAAAAILCAALSACAAPALPDPDVARVTVLFTTVDAADAECEKRMQNGKRHWGCATYHGDDSCDIVVGDKDRGAVLRKELENCAAIRRARRAA